MKKQTEKTLYTQLPKNLREIMQEINRNGMGVIFIVDKEQKLIGSLTDGDIRRAIISGIKIEDKIDNSFNFLNLRPFSLPYQTSVQKILEFLDKDVDGKNLKCIPLLSDDGKIIDVATRLRTRSFPASKPEIGEEELTNVIETIKTGYISSVGKFIQEFEKLFEQYIGSGHAVAVSSGTTALQLGLSTFNLKKGDEVIVPDFTFGGSINAIINVGATPVIADINLDDWTISLKDIEKKITKNTRAIMPVHIYGQPAQMDEISKLAKEKNLLIIEDCAEAIGARYKDKLVGSHGNCSCFSFFANKTLTTGEGGMVLFRKKEDAAKAKILRDHGMSKNKKYWHEYSGFNYRMTNMQAAIGVAQIKKINNLLSNKKKIFDYYDKQLVKNNLVSLMPKNSWSQNSYWVYTLRVNNFNEKNRDIFLNNLKERGIDCRPGFYPLHTMKPYKIYGSSQFENTVKISNNSISLPSASNLTREDQDHIIKVFSEELNKMSKKNGK